MAGDVVPLIDIRRLSHREISALASPSAVTAAAVAAASADPCHASLPAIDRSVFNESTGSRKQTCSRLRLSPQSQDPNPSSAPLPRRRGRPRRSSPLPPLSPAPTVTADSNPLDNRLIVSFLHQLFARDSPPPPTPLLALPPPPPPTGPLTLTPANGSTPVQEIDNAVLNEKGHMVNLSGMGNWSDPYGEELRRRTAGLASVEQLIGYLCGLDGQWKGHRRRKKIIDASIFGDHLPKGWKLLIGIRKKDGFLVLDCRRYISPSGKKFISCKEVSTYILSLIEHKESRQLENRLTSLNIAGPIQYNEVLRENRSYPSSTCLSISTGLEKRQGPLVIGNDTTSKCNSSLICHKGNLTFDNMNDNKNTHMQHMPSLHQGNPKKRKHGKAIVDGVIMKDGKYECQFCHKIFNEKRPYYGHIGAHVRYQGLTAEGLPKDFIRKNSNILSLATASSSFPETIVPFTENKGNHSSEAIFKPTHEKLIDSSNGRFKMKNRKSPFPEPIHDKKADSSRNNLDMANFERNLSKKQDVPAAPVVICSSMNGNPTGCSAVHSKSDEIVGTIDVTDVKSSGCDVSASLISAISSVDGKPPKVSDDASISKCADICTSDFQFTDSPNSVTIETCKLNNAEFNGVIDACIPPIDDISNANNTSSTPISIDVEISAIDKTVELEVAKLCSVVDAKFNEGMDAVLSSPTMIISDIASSKEMEFSPAMNVEMIKDGVKHPSSGSNSNTMSCDGKGFGHLNSLDGNTFDEVAGSKSPDHNLDCVGPSIPIKTTRLSNQHSPSYAPISVGSEVNMNGKTVEPEDADLSTFMDAKLNECMTTLPPSLTNISTTKEMAFSSCTMNLDMRKDGENLDFGSKLSALSCDVDFGDKSMVTSLYKGPVAGNTLDVMDGSINETEFDFMSSQDKNDIMQVNIEVESHTRYEQEIDLQSCVLASLASGSCPELGNKDNCSFDCNPKESFPGKANHPNINLENCFNINTSGCCEDAAPNIINDNIIDEMQVDVTQTPSSWSQSSPVQSFIDIIQDQYAEGQIVIGQKHDHFSDFDVRDMDSSNVVLFTDQELASVTEHQLEFGFAGQLENKNQPGQQIGWEISAKIHERSDLSNMCVWCSREFKHGLSDEIHVDSVGFICHECRLKFSGQLNLYDFAG